MEKSEYEEAFAQMESGLDSVKEALEERVFETTIPRNVRLAEAPSHGLPINLYDPKSTGSESYRNLAKEIIGRKDI